MLWIAIALGASVPGACPSFFDPGFDDATVDRCAGDWLRSQAMADWIDASRDHAGDDRPMSDPVPPEELAYRSAHYAYVDCLQKGAEISARADAVRPSAVAAVFAKCVKQQNELTKARDALPEQSRASVEMRGAPENFLWATLYQLMYAMNLGAPAR